jgi:hypothetical protein
MRLVIFAGGVELLGGLGRDCSSGDVVAALSAESFSTPLGVEKRARTALEGRGVSL